MPFAKQLLLAASLAATAFAGFSQARKAAPKTTSNNVRPAWVNGGNVYEVNVRQYTQEGTFAAFAKSLPRLKAMGVQTLWMMPINPISVKDRKGVLGSYYAISDYKAINPEFGNLADFTSLVKQVHGLGMKIIIDWVPNHTGADHYWLRTNPDFYELDEKGEAKYAFDWTDTRSLNYDNPKMVDSMIAQMQYWLRTADIDGFRCDVAGEVPDAFWQKAIPQLRRTKSIFMLAEADKPEMHTNGFDASYPWEFFAMTKRVASGETNALAVDTVLNKYRSTYQQDFLKLWFTSNHDENSWNKADYGTMPGAVHAPFAVLTQTLPNGMPLIYSGQESAQPDSISFFYKDQIQWGNYSRASFYKALLAQRRTNAAFAPDASFTKLKTNVDKQLYAFERMKNGRKLLVICNLSNQAVNGFNWIGRKPSAGAWKPVLSAATNPQKSFGIEPWGYVILVQ